MGEVLEKCNGGQGKVLKRCDWGIERKSTGEVWGVKRCDRAGDRGVMGSSTKEI